MKLRNKLLPLIGTAAIAATATPLALTSCSSTKLEMIDITDGSKAIPTINPMDAAWMGQKAWTTAYVKACKENPEIFRQDFIYGIYKRMIIEKWDDTKIDYVKVGVSTPTFGTVNISYPGEPDVIYPTISVTYRLQYSKEQTMVGESSYMNDTVVKDMTVTLNNVPFIINAYTEQFGEGEKITYRTNHYFRLPGMETQPGQEGGSNDFYIFKFDLSSWSIDYSYTEDTTTTSITQSGKTVTENNNSDSGTYKKYSDISDSKNLMFLDCCFDSNYLSNVVIEPELVNYRVAAGSRTNPIPATFGTGLSIVPHSQFTGLYLPANERFGTILTNSLKLTLFADYAEDGTTRNPLILERVLPEGSTADAKFLKIPATELEYNSDAVTGWNGPIVTHDGASYIPFLFPAETQYSFYKTAECKPADYALLQSTKTAAGLDEFTFALPKYVMVHFKYYSELLEKDVEWDQQVWLSQEEMALWVNFTAA